MAAVISRTHQQIRLWPRKKERKTFWCGGGGVIPEE